jgi:hypothetical protein
MDLPICRYCRRRFRPNPRIGEAQKVCSRKVCQRARKRAKLRHWLALHPDRAQSPPAKVHAWAEAYPDYWRQYRKGHPAYYQQDLARRRKAYRRSLFSAKETLIDDISRRKLEALEALQPPNPSAKETPIHRRVEVVVDYLVWKARSAKESPIDSAATHGG